MEKDIFEDMRDSVGCTYISDLPYQKQLVWNTLQHVSFAEYPAAQLEDFFLYVFGFSYTSMKHVLKQS